LPAGFSTASIYDHGYFQGQRADGYADYAGSAAVLRREFSRVVERLGHRQPAGNLLEIGCAYGYLLEEASRRYRCRGVELSPAAREVCQQKGLDVCGDISELDISQRYEVVVMLDVVEHLVSPLETLTQLRSLMAPGGVLVLSTGDWGSPLARVMGKGWRLMTPPQHLWFFTQRSLRSILDRAGFEVQAIEHPWKIVPLELAVYQLTRRLKLPALRWPPLARLGLPVNLFDAMAVTAVAR
jgi:SAM-dependent methyltransferase